MNEWNWEVMLDAGFTAAVVAVVVGLFAYLVTTI
jgi:hypothetical protein